MPIPLETYEAIFEEIAEGKSLRSCLTKYKLAAGSFYTGLDTNTKLSEQYARVRGLQAEASFEKILNLAEQVEKGLIEAQAARVAIDTYKWVAARLKPTVYAERGLLDNASGNTPTELIVRWGQPKDKVIKDIESVEIETKTLDA
jgi:hypothetical protein